MFLVRVYVTLKPTVNDPQGLTIKGGLHALGFDKVKSVRAGKYMELQLEEEDPKKAEEQIQRMGKELLANPVIENFRYELEQLSPNAKSS